MTQRGKLASVLRYLKDKYGIFSPNCGHVTGKEKQQNTITKVSYNGALYVGWTELNSRDTSPKRLPEEFSSLLLLTILKTDTMQPSQA